MVGRLPLSRDISVIGSFRLLTSDCRLVAKNRREEARAIIATYHTNGDIDHPLVALQMREMAAAIDEDHQASWKDLFDLSVLVESRSSRYRLMLNIAFSWFGQFSGNKSVMTILCPQLAGLTVVLVSCPTTCPSCLLVLESQAPTPS